jgi:hypothetical protein
MDGLLAGFMAQHDLGIHLGRTSLLFRVHAYRDFYNCKMSPHSMDDRLSIEMTIIRKGGR